MFLINYLIYRLILQGDYKKCSNKISTHNSRLESIQTSTVYSPSLKKQQRCIVICEGFYEWKPGTDNKLRKQPYYIYATQDKDVKADDSTTWVNEFLETDGWKGLKVLKLAGIFGTHKTEEVDKLFFCFIPTMILSEFEILVIEYYVRGTSYIAAPLLQERVTRYCLGCIIACQYV